MTQHITVVNYDPSWQLKYEHEKQKIRAILDSNLLAVYHIGSTAVANLAAKPIIDITAVVRDLSLVDINKAAFEKIGYEYLGEFGIKGRRYLRKGGDERTHQIHIFRYDNLDEVIRHLAFRDYLRVQNDVCAEYAKLKKALAVKFPYDIDGYCDGKDGFVKDVTNSVKMIHKERSKSDPPFYKTGGSFDNQGDFCGYFSFVSTRKIYKSNST